ncbi:RNA polymerase sigma factor [Rosistilla carotiformis]|uniref:RNA polymerase sigma factor n=1 Tax=Rosistilla carotiformis TaxID=2528017 RepID=A0A518JWU8_9BACT|nr:sigma-70 family RNA polymerase sigma factor [Rosistilla carotiformis]QDV70019.1 RNA polymerase sigma factor [Rosistilla carotiformis]
METEPFTKPDEYELFLRLFLRDQFRVLGYIRSLIYQPCAVDDVYQETCLELWRSFSSFRRDEDFAAWALGVTRHQVLKHWRTRDRDRHVFSEALMQEMSATAVGIGAEINQRQAAMDECVKLLSERQRELVQLFYGENESASQIAKRWRRSVHAVYKSLKVMRRSLFDCVESKLANESA